MLAQNGIRQPQASSWFSGSAATPTNSGQRAGCGGLPTCGQALTDAQEHQHCGGEQVGSAVVGQAADQKARGAHRHEGDKERAFAAFHIMEERRISRMAEFAFQPVRRGHGALDVAASEEALAEIVHIGRLEVHEGM